MRPRVGASSQRVAIVTGFSWYSSLLPQTDRILF